MSTTGRRKAKDRPAPGSAQAEPEPVRTRGQLVADLDGMLLWMIGSDGGMLRKSLEAARDQAGAAAGYEDIAAVASYADGIWCYGERIERLSARIMETRDVRRNLAEQRQQSADPGELVQLLIDRNARASLDDIPSHIGVGDPFHAASIESRRFGRAEARRDIDNILWSFAAKIADAPDDGGTNA